MPFDKALPIAFHHNNGMTVSLQPLKLAEKSLSILADAMCQVVHRFPLNGKVGLQSADAVVAGLKGSLDGLEGLEGDSLDYTEAVHQYLEENKVSGAVRKILLDAIGG